MAIQNFGSAVKPPSSIEPFGGNMHQMYEAEMIAKLRGSSTPLIIKTPLPANYQFELSTSFDNPLNQPLSNIASGMLGSLGASVDAASTAMTSTMGHSSINKWLSGATWTGGSLFQIQVPFVLQAFTSTREEVVKKMRDMLKLVAPGELPGGFLTAPGPTMANATGFGIDGDEISIRIGTFFKMEPCVVKSITCDFDTQMDVTDGMPLGAVVQVTFESYFAVTKQDLERFFLV